MRHLPMAIAVSVLLAMYRSGLYGSSFGSVNSYGSGAAAAARARREVRSDIRQAAS